MSWLDMEQIGAVSLLSENMTQIVNLHHSDVDELLESMSGDFFQRHVCQSSVGQMEKFKHFLKNYKRLN